ncbi:MAG: DEAD/DEAH box helicase family protein [Deltaproteobacteria bacterium]|nr:DEAD/DEAH box helicase family protein [Deltaproteobacteria bacterium]
MVWKPGMKLVHRAQREWGVGVILAVQDDGRRLQVRFAGRPGTTIVSGRDPALAAVSASAPLEVPPAAGPLGQLLHGRVGQASAFRLRARVARLEALRRADSLGALLSSRVHVLPHQVGAAGRILADRTPRFVLADEVGLGKTIEAGLVFAGLRQIGLAERVLVVAPEHLCFQWMAELFHKFNALFTLLTRERIAELGGPETALARSPLAILSFEQLRGDEELADACWEAETDLLVVDEAHHLADDALFEAVAPVALESFGLLLLTATPVRLDPREYWRLLGLVEQVPTTSLSAFKARLARHEAVAEVARGLLAGGDAEAARARLAGLAPGDAFFSAPRSGEALLAHLAEHHSLSARLVRNRRAQVGAFTRRVLRREAVPAGGKEAAAAGVCARLARSGEKVLCFGADVAALAGLRTAIAGLGLEALLYDEAETIEQRDRLVARFRDPEGPRILLSGESGGEGRNFQFACHLVCYDLPPSPLTLEQRIGRLDRLGQHRPVEIHLLPEPGEEAFLADLYEQVIGIFDEPVGGLDAVLASLPAELLGLRGAPEERREEFRRALSARVAEGRRAQIEAYDPLLDIRSAALPELSALTERGLARVGEGGAATSAPTATASQIRERLSRLSQWLEEELEEVVTEVGRRAGLDVDTDQNVNAFEVAFTLGAHMRIDALPGMTIPEDPETHLGSFWRETAVVREELEWFATGHRLVEALVGLARDGDAGRTAVVRAAGAPRGGALLARFHVALPQPADVDPGARVPSRQAARYLDQSPLAACASLEPRHPLRPDLVGALDAGELTDARLAGPLDPAAASGAFAALSREVQEELGRRREAALALLSRHAEAEEERLQAAAAGGADPEVVEESREELQQHLSATAGALRRARLEADAIAVLVP